MTRRYGPHAEQDARQTVIVGARSNEHPEPLHPALIEQRRVINERAHTGHATSKPLAPLNADEWAVFVAAVRSVVDTDGLVHANDVRPLIRGRVFHKSIGRFYKKATDEGLLERLPYEPSRDVEGRNTHHGSGVFRIGVAA